jgi:excisionase family DNA binding protein
MATTDPRPLATPAELSEYLQIPERTLVDWRRRGIGPYRRIGRHVRYPWPGVDAWVEHQARAS